MNIYAARLYVSLTSRPLNEYELETRRIAHGLKMTGECLAPGVPSPAAAWLWGIRRLAGQEMAQLICPACYLIPVPNHLGETLANAKLAEAIRAELGPDAIVRDELTRFLSIDSQMLRHRAGKPVRVPAAHWITRRKNAKSLTLDRPVYFVDNLSASGNTLAACRIAMLEHGAGLVFARTRGDSHARTQ